MVSICASCGEVSPVCPKCGRQVLLRVLGTGRIPKPGTTPKEFGANHQALLAITKSYPEHWFTVREYQYLVERSGVGHQGRRRSWNYVAIQTVLSDLVGSFKLLEMRRPTKGHEFLYRLKHDSGVNNSVKLVVTGY